MLRLFYTTSSAKLNKKRESPEGEEEEIRNRGRRRRYGIGGGGGDTESGEVSSRPIWPWILLKSLLFLPSFFS